MMRRKRKENRVMLNKKLIPVVVPIVALLLLAGAMMSVAAQPKAGINVPPGDIVVSPNANMANDTPRKPVPAAPSLTGALPGAATETFDGSPLSAWRGITDSAIKWVAQDGRLQEYLAVADEPADVPALFVSTDANFTSGTAEAYVYPTAGSPVGIVLRGSDQGYYRVTIFPNVTSNSQPKAQIERVDGNRTTVLAQAPISAYQGYTLEQWQHVVAAAQGNTITVSVDGKQIMSATDGTFTKGWAGVWTLADQGASFDNLRIQPTAAR